MIKTVFVFNTGSSSVKISLLAPPISEAYGKESVLNGENEPSSSQQPQPIRILTAHAERIGSLDSSIHISLSSNLIECILPKDGEEVVKVLNRQHSLGYTSRRNKDNEPNVGKDHFVDIEINNKPNMTHEDAIRIIVEEINNYDGDILSTVAAVGHRVVHGGSLSDAVIVDEKVMDMIRDVSHLAPLHNPNNLLGIQIGKEIFKGIPQIAVFDTAFHATLPEYAYTYPIPKTYRDLRIRKYGFHGTSVKYVSKIAQQKLDSLYGQETLNYEPRRLIIAHLGNGASITAVVDGKSVDTTMEFTPLSGLMMGTRSGSIDPTVVTFASSEMNKSPDDVMYDLNKRSGLMCISNGDSDMRTIEQRASSGDKDATLALEMFVYILAKHIAAMIVACGGKIDAVVFTAGIGENSPLVRAKTMALLQHVVGGDGSNSLLDDALNLQNGKHSNGLISCQTDINSQNPIIMVIHTDEECGIYEECERLTNTISI